jgi:ATP-dependent Clp protease ATP-binding subunit ClpA
MQNNPEIEHIVEQAVKIARDKHHEYVITEHLLLSLIRHAPFRKTLDRFGVEVTQMEQEVDAYLDSLKHWSKLMQTCNQEKHKPWNACSIVPMYRSCSQDVEHLPPWTCI